MSRPFFLDTPRGRLFAVDHGPEAGARGAAVLAPPFLEEAKHAERALHALAEALAAAGIRTLRLDYRGTGDSEGAGIDFSPRASLDDIRAGREWLRRAAGVEPGLVGCRFGGLAAGLASEGAPWLVLWQPSVAGRSEVEGAARRAQVRRALTAGRAGAGPVEGPIDLDGVRISADAVREFATLDLVAASAMLPSRVLVVQAAARPEPASALRPLLSALGARGRFEGVVQEPFWEAWGSAKGFEEGVRRTVEWIRSCL